MYRERRIRVFVVEDFKLQRMNLKKILSEESKIEVVGEAESVEKCLEKLRNIKPDVILMDLGLPGLSGIEGTFQIKRFYPETKIIILSAHEEALEVLAALHAGADGYCLSNYSLKNIGIAIQAAYHGSIWLDPYINKDILKLLPKLPPYKVDGTKFKLTEREMEVLGLLAQGKTNIEIAEALFVSVHTAKAHVGKILQKLKVKDRVQAATKAIKENLV